MSVDRLATYVFHLVGGPLTHCKATTESDQAVIEGIGQDQKHVGAQS